RYALYGNGPENTIGMKEEHMKRVKQRGKNLNLIIGGGIIVVFLSVMIVSFFYTLYDSNGMDVSNKLPQASKGNWLGKDDYGRDIDSRVMSGSKTAFLVASVAVGIGLIFGPGIGSVAGYIGGWIDAIMMPIMDPFKAFPGIILALMLV